MPPTVASLIFTLLIALLFWLERDRRVSTSPALWIPTVWLLLACSRSVAEWLQIGNPVSASNSSDQQNVMEGDPVNRAIFAGLLVLGMIVLAVRTGRIGKLLKANLTIVIFFAFCALSLIWSDYPDIAFKRWTKAIGDLVMVLIVLSDREPLAAVKEYLARTAFLVIPLSVLFVKYYPDLGRSYGRWDYKTFYTGVTTNKNTLGVICLFFGLASVWRLLVAYRDPSRKLRIRHLIAHGVVVAMVIWLFSIANSMTALSCFLIGICLLLLTNFRFVRRKPVLVHLLVLSFVLASASIAFWGFGSDFVKDTMARDTSTLTDRTNIWKLALSVSRSPLVGTGFESFWLGPRLHKMWEGFSWHPEEAHDGYLEIYLNLGWVGVSLLAVVVATGYRKILATYRSNPLVGSLVLVFFTVGVIYNFTEAAFFRMMAPAWLFFLLAISSASVISRPSARSRPRSNRTPRMPENPVTNQPTLVQETA